MSPALKFLVFIGFSLKEVADLEGFSFCLSSMSSHFSVLSSLVSLSSSLFLFSPLSSLFYLCSAGHSSISMFWGGWSEKFNKLRLQGLEFGILDAGFYGCGLVSATRTRAKRLCMRDIHFFI